MAKGIKTGGRVKGTPNKTTSEIREAYKMLIENNLDNLSKWVNELAEKNPEKAIDIIIKMSEYVIPKLTRSEARVEVKESPIINLGDGIKPKEKLIN